MKQLLDQYGIQHYSTKGEAKVVVAKQFNRTLKELTYKYMTVHNTLKYLGTLPELLTRYNGGALPTSKALSDLRISPNTFGF